jgi:hypothetical protein
MFLYPKNEESNGMNKLDTRLKLALLEEAPNDT